jgi:hypothetical protein
MFAELLSSYPPTPSAIAAKISQVLRRNEESRIYHWHRRTRTFPPRRPPGGAARKKRKQVRD